MIATSGPAAMPTVPGLRTRGGSGFAAIWCAASVIPYDSTSGAPNTSSISRITCVGIADDDERMKRSGLAAITALLLAARPRIAWCIVGTAVYQVGRASSIQPKNLSALKPGVQHTWPPADSGARIPAISPWMWNSGMMFRPRSVGESARNSRMLRAEAQTLRCESGTIFGRDVVPEVCSTSATSSGWAKPPWAGLAAPAGEASRSSKLPAPRSGCASNSMMRTPSLRATSSAGEVLPASTSSAFAFRSDR